MYKRLLIRRYLGRKLAPMFAALAVTLCAAMVIIVISVMGGFLDLMRNSAQRLTGDVTIRAGWTGFPYYEELINDLKARPQIHDATAIVRAAGMIKFGQNQVYVVPEILGIEPDSLSEVTFYRDALYWTSKHFEEVFGSQVGELDPIDMGMTFEPPGYWQLENPDLGGVVPGIELYPYNTRDDSGQYDLLRSSINSRVTLTVLPVTLEGGVLAPSVRQFVVVNEFKSGLFEIDKNRVYVPFGELQRMQKMDAAPEVDPETGLPTGGTIPGRASEIIVKGAAGFELSEVGDAVEEACKGFVQRHPEVPGLSALTWEQIHRELLTAVRNEKGLITFLFAFISLVAVVMVATTFSMIVFEKTKDIGVLRAIGASRSGVAGIFLGYGLAVGLVGALTGVTLAVLIVYNLNELQDLLDAWFGWRMWDAKTYYFDQIPEQVDPTEVVLIAVGAVLSSVGGAIIPAFLAARLDPVESLRYE